MERATVVVVVVVVVIKGLWVVVVLVKLVDMLIRRLVVDEAQS